MMIERLVEADDATAVFWIRLVEGFDDGSLSLGRVHVFVNWLDDLHTGRLTFTA